MNAFIDFVAVTSRLPVFIAGQAAIILTRLILGIIFIGTGWGKLSDFPQTVENFTKWGFVAPSVNAGMAGVTELVGGILLVLGLGTRAAAALLGVTMLVACLTVHRLQLEAALHIGNPPEEVVKSVNDLTDITPVVYLIFMLWLVGSGGGKIALDRLLEIWWKRRRAHQAIAAAKA